MGKELRYDPEIKMYITKDDYIDDALGGLPDVDWLAAIWEELPQETPNGENASIFKKPTQKKLNFYFFTINFSKK